MIITTTKFQGNYKETICIAPTKNAIKNSEGYFHLSARFMHAWTSCFFQALRSVAVRFLDTINVERKIINQIVDITVYFHTSVQVFPFNLVQTRFFLAHSVPCMFHPLASKFLLGHDFILVKFCDGITMR